MIDLSDLMPLKEWESQMKRLGDAVKKLAPTMNRRGGDKQ